MFYTLACFIADWVIYEAHKTNLFALFIYCGVQDIVSWSPYIIFTIASVSIIPNIRSVAKPTILNIIYFFKNK